MRQEGIERVGEETMTDIEIFEEYKKKYPGAIMGVVYGGRINHIRTFPSSGSSLCLQAWMDREYSHPYNKNKPICKKCIKIAKRRLGGES